MATRTVICPETCLQLSPECIREMANRGLPWAEEALQAYLAEKERINLRYQQEMHLYPERRESLHQEMQDSLARHETKGIVGPSTIDDRVCNVRSHSDFLAVIEGMGRAALPKYQQGSSRYHIQVVEIPPGYAFGIGEMDDGSESVWLSDPNSEGEDDEEIGESFDYLEYVQWVKVKTKKF